jgi:hypothetical protein
MEDEAGARGFIAGAHGSFRREAAKEAANLYEIAGQPDDLGVIGIVAENGGGDRILMNIETDPDRLAHGWIPPIES